jgi:hypothetical protein
LAHERETRHASIRYPVRFALVLSFFIPANHALADGDPPVFIRLDKLSDEELRKQLLLVPEVGLDRQNAVKLYAIVEKMGRAANGVPADIGFKLYRDHVNQKLNRPDLMALPWREGPDCQLGNEAAQRLHVLSRQLRRNLRDATPGDDIRPNPKKLAAAMAAMTSPEKIPEWKTAAAIPTIMQMLQAENSPIRELLVERLAEIDGKEASEALAQRALFDLSPEVREKAVTRLARRPAEEFQQVLVDGIRWPWAPVAQHAAEAIAFLKLKAVVPELVVALEQRDPRLAFVDTKEKTKVIRELVRINHLSNCLLCHAPSLSNADTVRGRIPHPSEEPPAAYYDTPSGQFVRADTTFLRQNFSVMQPVRNSGKWPGNQRFDYVLRTRKATAQEAEALKPLAKNKKSADYPQREAALFALRGITGMDVGRDARNWATLLELTDGQLGATRKR